VRKTKRKEKEKERKEKDRDTFSQNAFSPQAQERHSGGWTCSWSPPP
jgi:hypothetical protein